MISARKARPTCWAAATLLVASVALGACGVSRSRPSGASPGPQFEAMYHEMNEGSIAVADGIVRNMWPARGFPDAKLPSALTWTEDPYDDAYFRFMFYSLRNLENLLFAYSSTNDAKYLNKLTTILDSFIAYDADRPYDPEKFDDRHSSGYRAMVLTNMYFKLKAIGMLSPSRDQGLRDSIERVSEFLMKEENFESWANHGFTEAAALLLVATTFADMPDAEAWRNTGIERLELMRDTNVDGDGVDVENSPFYHQYVLGLISQIADWAQLYEPELGATYHATRVAMLKYLAYVAQPNGELPLLGASQQTTIQSRDPKLFAPLTQYDAEFEWAFSGGKTGSPLEKRVRLFPTAGLFTLRSHVAGQQQTYVSFDAGAYRTDHSDLDALSVTVYSDNTTLCPDSGLFTYLYTEDYDYFHGTRAHNTVVVDGKDQLEGAAFPGAYGVSGRLSWATAMSTAYYGVKHARTVMILDQSLLLVADSLLSDVAHDYTQTWHFAPDASLKMSNLDATVSDQRRAPILQLRQAQTEDMAVATSNGGTDPLQGWYSDLYNHKQPMNALEYTQHGHDVRFATLLAMGSRAAAGKSTRVRESSADVEGARVIHVCAEGADLTVQLSAEGSSEATVVVAAGGGC